MYGLAIKLQEKSPMTITIAPSILSANFARLGEEVKSVLAAGADWIHIDVMDNHYVPNLTFGPMVCQALRDDGIAAYFDVHLMVKPVDKLIKAFAKAGANGITIHPNATDNLTQSLDLIQSFNLNTGLALNPDEPIELIEDYLAHISQVLIMSVYPGFSGQKFIPDVLPKLTQLKSTQPHLRLAIDGGVNLETIKPAATAGADTFIAGSAIFNTPDYQSTIKQLRESI